MPPLSPLAHEARGGPVKVDGQSPIGRLFEAIGRQEDLDSIED